MGLWGPWQDWRNFPGTFGTQQLSSSERKLKHFMNILTITPKEVILSFSTSKVECIFPWSDYLCLSKISMLKPYPPISVDSIKRLGLWEVLRSWGNFSHKRINVFIRYTTESRLTPFPVERGSEKWCYWTMMQFCSKFPNCTDCGIPRSRQPDLLLQSHIDALT